MVITEEMIAEDEKRWNDRNIVAELGYCGKNICHRKNITNDDIRFYAYIMRKAYALLKEQEAVEPILDGFLHKWCPSCRKLLKGKYCHECGQAVKWE